MKHYLLDTTVLFFNKKQSVTIDRSSVVQSITVDGSFFGTSKEQRFWGCRCGQRCKYYIQWGRWTMRSLILTQHIYRFELVLRRGGRDGPTENILDVLLCGPPITRKAVSTIATTLHATTYYVVVMITKIRRVFTLEVLWYNACIWSSSEGGQKRSN